MKVPSSAEHQKSSTCASAAKYETLVDEKSLELLLPRCSISSPCSTTNTMLYHANHLPYIPLPNQGLLRANKTDRIATQGGSD